MPLCNMVNKDLDIIISKYVGNGQFLVGKEMMKFTSDDIAKILDLPKGEKEITKVKNYKASSVLERLFEGKQRVKRLEVEQNLNKLLKVKNIEDVYLCVQLWICF